MMQLFLAFFFSTALPVVQSHVVADGFVVLVKDVTAYIPVETGQYGERGAGNSCQGVDVCQNNSGSVFIVDPTPTCDGTNRCNKSGTSNESGTSSATWTLQSTTTSQPASTITGKSVGVAQFTTFSAAIGGSQIPTTTHSISEGTRPEKSFIFFCFTAMVYTVTMNFLHNFI